jgi:hypothetical protein
MLYSILDICDELITHPRSPADCPRSRNRNGPESFTEAAKAQNWAVEPQGKKFRHFTKCKVGVPPTKM